MSFQRKEGFIQDRFTQGLVAGLISWVPQFAFIFPMKLFHLTKFIFADFTAIIAFNRRPKGIPEAIYAEFLVIALMATLGGIFAMLLKVIKSRNIRLKGAMYGGGVWFALYILVDLFKMHGIYGKVDFSTSLVNITGAVIYGVSMAWALLILNRKYGVENIGNPF